ncbi:MAG TPA: hypothetical protein VJU61_12440 [Polyangiaceae bacterium]|nr:hypothetical protein [Polyangiaceae bacterium]
MTSVVNSGIASVHPLPTENASPDKLAETFRRLDEWRHLPDYQLERRADIFFALYLQQVVQEATGVDLSSTLIPELPIKRDLVWPEKPGYQSVKVDYALFSKDGNQVYFVELKTNQGSRRVEQDTYLSRAKAIGFHAVVDGIVQISRRTKARCKYHRLLCELEGLGFVRLPPDLPNYLYPRPRVGLTARLRAIEVTARDPKVNLLYVQPRSDGSPDTIGFDAFARLVQQHPDPLSQLFARYLVRWQLDAATEPPGEEDLDGQDESTPASALVPTKP